MSVTDKRPSKVQMYPDGTGYFTVTAVIGTVELSSSGTIDPVEAAFQLIGKHRAPGEYHFPHEDGGEWVVSVEVREDR